MNRMQWKDGLILLSFIHPARNSHRPVPTCFYRSTDGSVVVNCQLVNQSNWWAKIWTRSLLVFVSVVENYMRTWELHHCIVILLHIIINYDSSLFAPFGDLVGSYMHVNGTMKRVRCEDRSIPRGWLGIGRWVAERVNNEEGDAY